MDNTMWKRTCQFKDIIVGESFFWGSYKQNENIAPIEWTVLSIESDKVLLISKYVLDFYLFDDKNNKKWQHCTLRRWLKNTFALTAFSKEERKKILSLPLKETIDITGCVDAEDTVTLLSVEEAKKFFNYDDDRLAEGTIFSYERASITDYPCYVDWWLLDGYIESPGAEWPNTGGEICTGVNTNCYRGVRPVIWIKKEVIVDICNNKYQTRQIIGIETSAFSHDRAKKVLEDRGDKVLDIQKEHREGEKNMKICIPHFKIGITFSGKYRKRFVEPFCNELLKLGYNRDDIFYDSWHDVLINGVHGDSILRQIYFKNCDCVVVLLSPDYQEKNWTGHIEWSAVKELINMGYHDKICLLGVDSVDIGKIDGLYKNQTIAKTIDDMSAVEIATFIHERYKMLF
ncbi:DUF6273 domain-containing protein [Anaeromassilibacillus sp. D41t1_190614_C2]|uniref:DUF6273 domain-containing protein n=1 Tax=Anaeromassilibacillus sp. D41t1_190614_C2 TaxID=2787078 RepID=UPI00189F0704|nr:DUF6273 domain-containing protein [Anaeromassilibacillus sp. D41t1_190614_C2]